MWQSHMKSRATARIETPSSASSTATRCPGVSMRVLLAQRLPKPGKQGHMLSRRPDRPIAQPKEEFRRWLEEREQEPGERNALPGVERRSKRNALETGRFCVGTPPRITRVPASRIAALGTPSGTLAVGQEAHVRS
jgi:hypothetical protein